MKTGLLFGIACAVVLHAGVILFGGVFLGHAKDAGTLQKVELLSEKDAVVEKEKSKPKEQAAEKAEKIETSDEKPPDAGEVVKAIELSEAARAPKLEAASLGAIEAALSGQATGGGDFADTLSFASGGRIGGTGKAGGTAQTLDQAFSLTEIDQKPRAVFQTAPTYPAGMKALPGLVTVIFIVDATGRVSSPRVEKSSNPAFDRPALDAIRQWKFEPAVKAGTRVPCKMRVPIRFQPR